MSDNDGDSPPPPKRPKIDTDQEDEEDFGIILPTLIRQLKNILNQYPDNGQVIKEIIQNAEDAGASTVKFLYDENETETLFSQGIDKLKGPSLYSFNDASFTDEDWVGIQMIGESKKEKDPMKVGKFGLGFKSVFHITDNPVIMSGKKLGIINPDEELFSDQNKRRTGKIFDFEKHPPDSSYHVDASDVFKNILHLDLAEGKCNGTAFRFVLRREASKLSKTIYNEKRVRELFQSFKAEGHLALMFLKNLAKVEFYTREKGSSHAGLLFSFNITQESNEKVRKEERSFMDDVKEACRSPSPVNKHLVNQVNIDCCFEDGTSTKTKSSTYTIVHYYGGQLLHREHEYTSEEKAKDQGLIPLVGVAYQKSENKLTDGHIFCALPLPVIEEKSTGLPVHVNGYFALGPDRKDLKWPSLEQSAGSDKEISWNLFLLQKVLPAAYTTLFQQLKVDEPQSHIVYNLLPDVRVVVEKWREFARKVLSEAFNTECLWSDAISKWISIGDACITDKSRNGHESASAFLKKCASPVVCISEHVDRGMKACSINIKEVNPKELVHIIAKNCDKLDSMTYKDRIDLLRYTLEDPFDITDLFDVPILPLEDGGFARPQDSNRKPLPLFMTSNDHPISLVPGCEKHIIKIGMQEDITKSIKVIAEKNICQVSMLNEKNLASLLKRKHLPSNKSQMIFQNQELTTICPSSWCPLIWSYINKYGILQDFEELPLIPIGTEQAFKEVAVLHTKSFIIYYEKDEEGGVISLLHHLGCTIIKELPGYVRQNRSVFQCKYIYDYKDEDLLQLLSNLSSKLGQNEVIRKFSEFTGKEVKLEFFRKVSHCPVKHSMQTLIKCLQFIENTSDERLVSVNECSIIAPTELPDVMPQRMLLKVQHEAQVSFIEGLGGRQLSKRDFIEEILLPEIHRSTEGLDGNNQSMINYILDSIAVSNDKQQWQAVINALSSVRFLQSDDGQLHKPNELFRRCERLEKLFVGEEGRFSSIRENIEVLQLKNESDVSADDIGCSLGALGRMEDIQTAQNKAKCILQHLEDHADLLKNERLRNEMNITAWIPIDKKRPDVYPDCLNWYGEKSMRNFGKPVEMATKSDSNLVGSVRAVILSDIEDFRAIKIAMKSRQFNHQDVINQLIHTIDKYDRKYRHKLMIALNEIYCYLQTSFNELTGDQVEFLKSTNWLWCENCFVRPQQIILKECNLDMRPYIYNLPQEMVG